jgi:hypothetical protein
MQTLLFLVKSLHIWSFNWLIRNGTLHYNVNLYTTICNMNSSKIKCSRLKLIGIWSNSHFYKPIKSIYIYVHSNIDMKFRVDWHPYCTHLSGFHVNLCRPVVKAKHFTDTNTTQYRVIMSYYYFSLLCNLKDVIK